MFFMVTCQNKGTVPDGKHDTVRKQWRPNLNETEWMNEKIINPLEVVAFMPACKLFGSLHWWNMKIIKKVCS